MLVYMAFVRECMIFPVSMFRSLYSSSVDSSIISNMMHGIALSLDLELCVVIFAYARHPSGL